MHSEKEQKELKEVIKSIEESVEKKESDRVDMPNMPRIGSRNCMSNSIQMPEAIDWRHLYNRGK